MAKTLAAEYGLVLEWLPDEERMRYRAGHGPWIDTILRDVVLPTSPGFMAWFTMRSRAPVVVEDLPRETRFEPCELLMKHGVRSGIAVTIAGSPGPSGVLEVNTRAERRFTYDEVNFVWGLANVLAISIERERAAAELGAKREQLQALSRRLITAQEEERRAIARELHDDFGQVLTALRLNLQRGAPDEKENITLVDGAIARMRDLAQDLRPPQLDELGLESSLRWYMQREASRAGLELALAIEALPDPPAPVVATTCFRVAPQEALTNDHPAYLGETASTSRSAQPKGASSSSSATTALGSTSPQRARAPRAARARACSGWGSASISCTASSRSTRRRAAGPPSGRFSRSAEARAREPADPPRRRSRARARHQHARAPRGDRGRRGGRGGQHDGYEALELAARTKASRRPRRHVSMPKMNGLEVATRMRKEHPETRVVIVSMHDDEEFVRRALAAGAAGYLLKHADRAELEMALRAVARGDTWLNPSVSKKLAADHEHPGAPQASTPFERLTPRQREVLQLIAEGLSGKEIASRLRPFEPEDRGEAHRTELMERLGIHGVAGLVRYALRVGLVRPET